MVETLLYRWIKEQLANYQEPERKGTPKGAPIGFSYKKFHATLLMLWDSRKMGGLKEVARLARVSHGLLRKWRTEEEFKKQVQENEILFAFHAIRYIEDRIKKEIEGYKKAFEQDTEDFVKNWETTGKVGPVWDMNEFADFGIYSGSLREKILLGILNLIEKRDDLVWISSLFYLVSYLSRVAGHKQEKSVEKALPNVRRVMQKELINDALKALKKPTLSNEERNMIALILIQAEEGNSTR